MEWFWILCLVLAFLAWILTIWFYHHQCHCSANDGCLCCIYASKGPPVETDDDEWREVSEDVMQYAYTHNYQDSIHHAWKVGRWDARD